MIKSALLGETRKPPAQRRFRLRFGALGAALVLLSSALAKPASAAGTWTAAPTNPGVGQAFGLWLLTDGRVISHGNALNHWVVLTPDAKGSYAKLISCWWARPAFRPAASLGYAGAQTRTSMVRLFSACSRWSG